MASKSWYKQGKYIITMVILNSCVAQSRDETKMTCRFVHAHVSLDKLVGVQGDQRQGSMDKIVNGMVSMLFDVVLSMRHLCCTAEHYSTCSKMRRPLFLRMTTPIPSLSCCFSPCLFFPLSLVSASHERLRPWFSCQHTFQRKVKLDADPHGDDFAFPSDYKSRTGAPRGFCNWVVPHKVMVGRYPHCTPIGTKTGSPTKAESIEHLRKIIGVGRVSVFVMLQAEVPAQSNDQGWPEGDIVPLANVEKAKKYPQGFVRYYNDAKHVAEDLGTKELVFLHFPIEDFGTPDDNGKLRAFIHDLCTRIRGGAVVYVHCWGGRGRAGTVGALLYLMLKYGDGGKPPEDSGSLDVANEALQVVQRGYDTRVGDDGKQSPETELQREFVREFARELIP